MRSPQPSSQDSIPAIEPMARFDGTAGSVDSIALAPDGSAAWFTVETPTLNVFAALQPAAPWIYFGYPLLVLLIMLVVVRRISKRPRVKGKEYCRGCNYDLSGSSSAAACPECGRDLVKHTPVIGRGRRWRYGVPVMIALAFMVGPMVWARTPSRLPRRVCELLNLWYIPVSPRAATDYPALAKRQLLTGAEVLYRSELDGSRARSLITTPRTFVDITVTPDGKHLVMPFASRQGVALYDSRTGAMFLRRMGKIATPPNIQLPLAIGFSPDGQGVFVQWADRGVQDSTCGVMLWNLRTNTMEPVVERTSWTGTRGFGVPSHYWMLDSGPAPVVLELPDFMQAYEEKRVTPVLHAAGAAREMTPITTADPAGRAAIATKLAMLFITEGYGRSILAVDLKTGERLGKLTSPAIQDVFWGQLAFNEAQHLLAAPMMNNAILIRDVENKQWIARLVVPEGCFAPFPSFSADGTKVCARVQRTLGGATTPPKGGPARVAGRSTNDGLVWDLSSVLNKTDAAEPAR